MKTASDWVTAYDVSGMNTASAAELEAWVSKIQEDARGELYHDLLQSREEVARLRAMITTFCERAEKSLTQLMDKP